MHNEEPKRRDFIGLAALWSFVAAIGTAIAGVARLPKPAVLPGPSRVFKLGDPSQFAVGSLQRVEEGNFFLFRDERGFHAISSVCTHLGCIVAHSEDEGFSCPCHGSRFTSDGSVVAGPAPAALPWLQVALAPDGQLQVNAEAQVAKGATFQV
jgi:cytochrome b6-f complex iron-sulfur subunit